MYKVNAYTYQNSLLNKTQSLANMSIDLIHKLMYNISVVKITTKQIDKIKKGYNNENI